MVLHLSDWLFSKRKQKINVGKDVEKRELCSLFVAMYIDSTTFK